MHLCMLRFFKGVLGLPRNTASSAILLDTDTIMSIGSGIERAIRYWVSLRQLPTDHIMTPCIEEQQRFMDIGGKPWLFYISQILQHLGFGYVWNRNGPSNLLAFKNELQLRIRDTYHAFNREEASGLKSLSWLMLNRGDNTNSPQSYINFSLKDRRIIAMLRFDLKYSLPIEHGSLKCKKCEQNIDCNWWDHFLNTCPALSPLPNDLQKIPYPGCVNLIMRNPNHIYRERLRSLTNDR